MQVRVESVHENEFSSVPSRPFVLTPLPLSFVFRIVIPVIGEEEGDHPTKRTWERIQNFRIEMEQSTDGRTVGLLETVGVEWRREITRDSKGQVSKWGGWDGGTVGPHGRLVWVRRRSTLGVPRFTTPPSVKRRTV